MASVVKMRRTRRGVEVTLRVKPNERGQRPTATVSGRVRDGALVTANGMKWRFR